MKPKKCVKPEGYVFPKSGDEYVSCDECPCRKCECYNCPDSPDCEPDFVCQYLDLLFPGS